MPKVFELARLFFAYLDKADAAITTFYRMWRGLHGAVKSAADEPVTTQPPAGFPVGYVPAQPSTRPPGHLPDEAYSGEPDAQGAR